MRKVLPPNKQSEMLQAAAAAAVAAVTFTLDTPNCALAETNRVLSPSLWPAFLRGFALKTVIFVGQRPTDAQAVACLRSGVSHGEPAPVRSVKKPKRPEGARVTGDNFGLEACCTQTIKASYFKSTLNSLRVAHHRSSSSYTSIDLTALRIPDDPASRHHSTSLWTHRRTCDSEHLQASASSSKTLHLPIQCRNQCHQQQQA